MVVGSITEANASEIIAFTSILSSTVTLGFIKPRVKKDKTTAKHRMIIGLINFKET
jgi:hypothetical protein